MSLLDIFTEKDTNKLLFLPNIGISNNLVNSYNNFINDQSKLLFQILDNAKLDYYVFAGSSIGLVRTGNNIPWVDDYDIIIFENDLPKFDKIILTLKKNQFITKTVNKTVPSLKPIKKINSTFRPFFTNLDGSSKFFAGYVIGSPRYSLNGYKTSFFQVDVFVSRNEGGKIKSIANWGLYHRKDVPMSYVKPQRFAELDGIRLPFFNQYEKDIELEYGTVLQTSVIHINHGREKIVIQKKWQDTYAEFENYKNIAINNTKKLLNLEDNLIENPEENNNKISNIPSSVNIQTNTYDISEDIIDDLNNEKPIEENDDLDSNIHDDNHEDTIKKNNLDVDIKSDNLDFFVDIEKNNYVDLMTYLSRFYNNVKSKELHIFNSTNILYIYDIKFYFKNISINFHINNIDTLENIRFFLDKVDIITLSDKNILENCEKYLNSLILNNRPIIQCDLENSYNLIKNNNLEEQNYLFDKKEKHQIIVPKIQMNKIINTTQSANKSSLIPMKTNSKKINTINNTDNNTVKNKVVNIENVVYKTNKNNTKFKSINSIKTKKIK